MPQERKRSLSVFQYSDIIPYRNQLNQNNRKLKNCIENLSTELIYEIFDYLDGCDIYQAFSNLNKYFQNLLSNQYLRLKIEFFSDFYFDSTIEYKIENYYEKYLLPNKHRIISLKLQETFIVNKFFSICTIDSSFINLQSISLFDISSLKFAVVLFYLRSLPCLYSLSVEINEIEIDQIGDIYRMIFQLPVLKYLKLEICNSFINYLNLPLAQPDEQSSIEYLSISHFLTVDDLIDLLAYTPRLTHLYCFTSVQRNSMDPMKISFPLKNLVHVSLAFQQINFDAFEEFIRQICSQLRVLTVEFSWTDQSYLNPNRWQNLIVEYMPNLERFTFLFNENLNKDFQIKSTSHYLISGFCSSFWFDRQWFYRISIDFETIVHSIQPAGSFPPHWKEIAGDVPLEISLDKYAGAAKSSEPYENIFNQIRPLFNMIQIRRLFVTLSHINYSTFIRIIDLLPNLHLLCIKLSSSLQEIRLNYIDRHEFRRFLTHNQITKLHLIGLRHLDEISFFVNLFPRVTHYTLNIFPNQINLESIVQYMIKKISRSATLCLSMYQAPADQVERFSHLIQSKHLLENFSIDRQYDKFYIQWN